MRGVLLQWARWLARDASTSCGLTLPHVCVKLCLSSSYITLRSQFIYVFFISLSIRLSPIIYLSLCVSFSVCLSIFLLYYSLSLSPLSFNLCPSLPLSLFISLSVCCLLTLCLSLSVCPSFFLSIQLFLFSLCLSPCLSFSYCISLSLSLSVSISSL